MSKITLIQGDATQLPIPSNSIDLIIAHPPYFGVDTQRYGGDETKQFSYEKNTQKKFAKLLNKATKEMYRVLKPSGHLWVAVSPFDGEEARYVNDVLNTTKFIYADRIFHSYYKDTTALPKNKPEGIASSTVSIWHHFTKSHDFYYNHIECKRYNNPVWEMDFSNLSDPIDQELFKEYAVQDAVNKELVARFIKMFTKPNHKVLDPFGGTGVVPVVAAELGRYGILNDVSEKQIKGAEKRILLTFGENNG